MKTISVKILCFALSVLFIPLYSAASAEFSAEWGNLTCIYTDQKVLIISGDGDIPGFSFETPNAWQHNTAQEVMELVIGEGITGIGDYCFYGYEELTKVTLPDSLTRIGRYAFAFCTELKEISLPGNLVSLGGGAFHGCTALSQIRIPGGIHEIRKDTFTESGLDQSVLPDSVTYIEDGAFDSSFSDDDDETEYEQTQSDEPDTEDPGDRSDPAAEFSEDYGILGFEMIGKGAGWNPVLYTMPDFRSPQILPDAADPEKLVFFAAGREGDWFRVLRCGETGAVGYIHKSEAGDRPVPGEELRYENITVTLPWENELYTNLFPQGTEPILLSEGTAVTLLFRDIGWNNTSDDPPERPFVLDYVETMVEGEPVRGWLSGVRWDWWERRWPDGSYIDDGEPYSVHSFFAPNEYYIAYPEAGISRFDWFAQRDASTIVTVSNACEKRWNAGSFHCYTWELSPDCTRIILADTATGETVTWKTERFFYDPLII